MFKQGGDKCLPLVLLQIIINIGKRILPFIGEVKITNKKNCTFLGKRGRNYNIIRQ